MSIDVRIYDNGDHTAIVWLPSNGQKLAGCQGFTIRRKRGAETCYLHGFVGFGGNAAPPAKGDEWQWPLQRFMWWDYALNPGDKVEYQVVPVTGTTGKLALNEAEASGWTAEMEVTGQCTASISSYFNRGVVASQWVSRALDQAAPGEARQAALQNLLKQPGNPLRDELGGVLKAEILKLLHDAKGGQVYAALYELNDPELIESVKALGKSMHLILANGAFSPAKPDENQEARKQLASVVDLHDRMVSSGHFAHNKFAVFCDAAGKPEKVLTGSTNWTWSGLCGQANNGLLINNAQAAQLFLDEWNRLLKAGNTYPAALTTENSKLKQVQLDNLQLTPWFAPTTNEQDMDYARKLIGKAKDGILFLFFNPGTYQEDPERETLLQDILQRHDPKSPTADPKLYIRGVVNQEIKGLTGESLNRSPVNLYSNGQAAPQQLHRDVLTPANIKKKFHEFEDEPLRATMVMVHSKVIVLDPFGANPVVMTGSHNLGVKASQKNDDNLVIMEGPGAAPIAAAYAVNIIAIYQTYRWNSYVTLHQADSQAWHGLQQDDKWQDSHLAGDGLAELDFWMAAHLEQTSPATYSIKRSGTARAKAAHGSGRKAPS